MMRHGFVTRDSRVTSRVSHGGVTRCVTWGVTVPRPDPSRPISNQDQRFDLKVGAALRAFGFGATA